LIEDAEVSGEVEGRVFVDDLPSVENERMPRKAVMLRSAGGEAMSGYNHNLTLRVDVLSFGGTRYEAGQVDLAVTEAIHYLKRKVVNNTLLHSVVINGGSQTFKMADTGWPVKMRSVIVRASLKEAT
jgi:hypothetical protein